ncbi:MAG: hypothetical protein GQ564_21660 [Bacteroidales bacterium]|nr:hypothetical protein [Bacteroidales bacterium]
MIPPVPQDVPELISGKSGIYVVTLQLWLKMLGYDCGAVDGQFGTSVKEQVIKFKKNKLNEETPDEIVGFDTWSAMDDLLKDRLPPDPEAIDRSEFPERRDYETEEAYSYAVRMGLEAIGFRPEVQEGEFYLEIDESGFGILDNIPAGIYSLEMADDSSTPTPDLAYDEEAGSMEVRLYDENENPIQGKVKLTNETPEPESLRKTIRLFKALSREKDVLEDKHGNEVNPKSIDGKFYATNKKMWEEFPTSWGQFYGAPWMGTIFDPTNQNHLTVNPGDINWATYETIELLYNWGVKHIEGSDDPDYALIGVRHLNHSKGGNTIVENLINVRSDFSQIGQSISLQLPRKTSRIVTGNETGQKYGGIDYDSDEYNTGAFEKMFKSFAQVSFGFQIRCPDKEIVDRLNEPDILTGGVKIQSDNFKNNRSINASANRRTLLKRKDSTCKLGYHGFPWIHDENGRIIKWRCIDLNFDKLFILDPKPDNVSFNVPSGIAAPILNVNQFNSPSLYKIKKGNLYPMVNTKMARLLNELMNSYGVVMLRYSNSYIEYKKVWNFWYYFELDSSGNFLADYSLHLYGIRLRDGAYDLIKGNKHFESNPLKIVDNGGYNQYSPGWWQDAIPPHVPSLHVSYSTNADRSIFSHIEAYSLQTGQIMGRFDNDGSNFTRLVNRTPTDAMGYYPLTNVNPADMAGNYLVHVDNGFTNRHAAIETAGQGYILFVWDVLIQEQGNSELLHELKDGTTITEVILNRIQLAYDQLRDSKISTAGTLRDRAGVVLIQAGRVLIDPKTLIPTNLKIIRTNSAGIEIPKIWEP